METCASKVRICKAHIFEVYEREIGVCENCSTKVDNTLFSEAIPTYDGYRILTVQENAKLQWRFDAKLIGNAFLAGPWRSTRPGSRSQGYMTLQLSRNGTYMCGHDYAMVFEESKAHFGVLLLARTSDALEKAWSAMRAARRELLPLTEEHNFASAD